MSGIAWYFTLMIPRTTYLRLLHLLRGNTPAQQLARGSLISFTIQAAGAGLIFFSEVILARALNAHGYGLYATVIAWLQVLAMVALLGSNHLLLRFVPAYVATREWSLLRGLLRLCNRGALLISTLIFALAAIALTVVSDRVSAELRWAFLIGLAALPVHALSVQRQSILRGLHRVATALSPEYIVRPLLLILVVSTLTWALKIPMSAPLALAINGVAIVLAFLLGVYWQRCAMPAEATAAISETRSHEWVKIAIPLFLIASMQLLIVRMDIILLGALAGREQAGIYAAASRVADLIVFALAAANAIVAPMISGFHARDDMAGLQHMMTLLAKGVLVFTAPLVLLVGIFGHTILGIFGEGYQIGYVPLLILVCGQLVNALTGPVDFLMYMTGHQQQSLRILALATALNLVLNLVLIPFYGLVGAAIATATTTMFWNFLMRRFVLSNLGVEASVLVLFRRRLRG